MKVIKIPKMKILFLIKKMILMNQMKKPRMIKVKWMKKQMKKLIIKMKKMKI